MFLKRCDVRCDESMAFPSGLRSSVRQVAARIAVGESHPPRHAFVVCVDGETLHIPYRVYYDPALLRQALSNAKADTRLILLCLGTRHDDGYLRQECLHELLRNEASWITPYLLQLAGEYVVQIAEDVAQSIDTRSPSVLRAFALENPSYLATFARRVSSYWHCYHRDAYPDRDDYPGAKVLKVLRSAVADVGG